MIAAIYSRMTILMVLLLAIYGCMNIQTRLQPADPSVKEVLIGVDCVPIVLGFGFGTATIESAMAKGEPITGTTRESYRRITKVRRVESAQPF